ncbi:MAG: 4-hydroxybenzoate octaprenyltransferase, partial [Cocleimonas sp.]|nr:4-hydroxybenzoate octaprenyltransferase [Cocleimonas sp.]
MLALKLKYYGQLIRIDKPIGSYLVLWPTLWALWFASKGIPDINLLIIFVLGVFLMRSAGCAINDYADRDFDAHVERTKQRPLAAGKIAPKEALMVFAVLILMAFILVLQLNATTLLLSIGALLLAASYPFMKRYHSLPQVHLGAAFAWSIPMAFTAVTENNPPLLAWLLFIATLLWITAYDTMYGMVDREDDLKIGIKSTAILFAHHDKLIIGLLQIISLLLLILIGVLAERQLFYFLGVITAAGFALYQHALIKERAPQACFKAFLNNN